MDAPVPESSLREKPKTEIVYSGRKRAASLPATPNSFAQSMKDLKSVMSISQTTMAELKANILARENAQQHNKTALAQITAITSRIETLEYEIGLLRKTAQTVLTVDAQLENELQLILRQQRTQTDLYAGAAERLTKLNQKCIELIPHVESLGALIKTLETNITLLTNNQRQLEETTNKNTNSIVCSFGLMSLAFVYWLWLYMHQV